MPSKFAKHDTADADATAVLQPYAGAEHQPFEWRGDSSRAALLIHGFPGTPAEMRGIGAHLVQHGITARGILLPGFGPEIGNLSHVGLDDWLHSVRGHLRELSAAYSSVMLVGNSMGAALATIAAAECTAQSATACPVEALLLFAPFWRIEPRWLDAVLPIGQHILRTLQPFKKADFANPETRTELMRVLGELDLDDPAVQESIRQISMPTSILAELRQAGRRGYRAAQYTAAPSIIFQGRDDPLAKPKLTRRLAAAYPHLAGYVELPGSHDLLTAHGAGFQAAQRIVDAFLTHLPVQVGAER